MYKKIVFVLLFLSVLLVACNDTATSKDVIPDSHVASFGIVCDTFRNVGMYTYAYHKDSGSKRATGYGYAVRMTDAEYEKECSQYE